MTTMKVRVLLHFPSRASEWATSIIMLNWALLIFYSKGSSLGHVNEALLNIMDVKGWSVVLFALAATRVALLIVNGSLRHSPHFRSAASFISCFVWFQIIIAFLNSGQDSMALAVYPVLLALDFYNTMRVAVEARISDDGAKNARVAA